MVNDEKTMLTRPKYLKDDETEAVRFVVNDWLSTN